MDQQRYDYDPDRTYWWRLPLLVTVPGIAILIGMIAFDHDTTPTPTALTAPTVSEQISIEESSDQCENLSILVTPTDESTPDALYEYTGDRELKTIPGKIDEDQATLLAYAYEVAKADGFSDPAVLQGLIWQESKAGGYPGYEVAGDESGLVFGERYYGIGQIKLAAARDVIARFPVEFADEVDRTDEYIIALLILDDRFNIRVASKYLWMMKHNTQSNYTRPTNYAITAYNRGLGNTYDTDYNNWHYTVKVRKHKDTFLKEFNLANNIK